MKTVSSGIRYQTVSCSSFTPMYGKFIRVDWWGDCKRSGLSAIATCLISHSVHMTTPPPNFPNDLWISNLSVWTWIDLLWLLFCSGHSTLLHFVMWPSTSFIARSYRERTPFKLAPFTFTRVYSQLLMSASCQPHTTCRLYHLYVHISCHKDV